MGGGSGSPLMTTIQHNQRPGGDEGAPAAPSTEEDDEDVSRARGGNVYSDQRLKVRSDLQVLMQRRQRTI